MKAVHLLLLSALMLCSSVASAQTYVGSFRVSDGPNWTTNPPVYSAQEAAALLFGGSPADYAISIDPSTTDPNTITHTAYYSEWGTEGCPVFPEAERFDDGAPGYNDPGGDGTALSAYVEDNCVLAPNTNHVWRLPPVVAPVAPPVMVPTLGSWGMLILAFSLAMLGIAGAHVGRNR